MANSVDATIVFTGSCGYVLNPTNDRARVLLPDGCNGWDPVVNPPKPPIVVAPHNAYIRFSMKHYDNTVAGNRKPDLVYLQNGEMFSICLLQKEKLSIPGSLGTFFANRAGLAQTAAMSPANQDDLHWVAKMSAICDNHALRDWPSLPLAALVEISHGTLETHFCRQDIGSFSPRHETDPAPYRQPFASQVRLRTTAPTPFVIQSDPLPGGTARSALTLQPVDDVISVEIGTEVLDDLLFPNLARDRSHDFELLFKLTVAPAGDGHVPTIHRRDDKRLKKVDCRGAFFDDVGF